MRIQDLIPAAILLTAATIAAAQPRHAIPAYDPATEVTLTGTVEKVTEHHNDQMMGKHIWLKTSSGSIEVHLGPAGFLAKEKVVLEISDSIEVTGSKVPSAGADAIIARSVKKGSQVWTLRNEKGVPAWSGQGKGKQKGKCCS